MAQAINRAPADEFPRIYAAKDDVMAGTSQERFAWMVDILIQGILFRGRPQ
ncbi:hypothetical protein [Actinoplanes sp. NBRC 103695]|uniref:hypothetical protein n=1 Tax=Actinoplanes sp. NBRC 103695 TaxID=3032202 RepID=UPI0024A57971|nr:hypothetical protein [Actinoplanes sp. NBRC 103695]GLZ02422.1 hypothetical protein Acsp02_96730 [Actinoplanes sp. NBRC 103695]